MRRLRAMRSGSVLRPLMSLGVLLVGFVAVANADGQCNCPDVFGFMFLPQLTHGGDDIKCGPINGRSASQISSDCATSSFCTSFVINHTSYCTKYVAAPLFFQPGYVLTTCEGTYLKSFQPSGCPAVSGYTTFTDTNSNGGDLQQITGDVNAIANACNSDCKCRSFNSMGWTKSSASTSTSPGMCVYLQKSPKDCSPPPLSSPPPSPPPSPSPPSPSPPSSSPPSPSPPPRPSGPGLVKSMAVGAYHTCALMLSGKVLCWGQNIFGQLGYPSYSAVTAVVEVDLGPDYIATDLSAGNYHTCALLSEGNIKCWGLNLGGQLGLGVTSSLVGSRWGEMGSNLPIVDLGRDQRAVAVSAGGLHTCALLTDGGIKCWGLNVFGALGRGDAQSCGRYSWTMGDYLKRVDLGRGERAVAVTTGWFHTCAQLASGRVKCWGYNRNGQLGFADGSYSATGVGIFPNDMGANLKYADLAGDVQSLSTKGHHTCATVAANGASPLSLKCWGTNGYSELGQADTYEWGRLLGSMGAALRPVDLGSSKFVMQASAGSSYSCAALIGGALKCWGSNSYGRLGLGTGSPTMGGSGHMGDSLPLVNLGSGFYVSSVSAGFGTTTCAVLNGGAAVKCWGRNSVGQLGPNVIGDRGLDPYGMGNSLPVVDLTNVLLTANAPTQRLDGPVPTLGPLPGADCESCVTITIDSSSGMSFDATSCSLLVSFLEANVCGSAPVAGISPLQCTATHTTMTVCGDGDLATTNTWQQGIDQTCSQVLVPLIGLCSASVQTSSTCGSYGNVFPITC